MIPWLYPGTPFPPVSAALSEPNGLLAAGGDLSPERLLTAYRHGIFPWYSPGEPILWWTPDPRMVLFPGQLKISRSLNKTLRNLPYTVECDRRFEQVMAACADTPRPGQAGTWITDEIRIAYGELHERGHAHSIEVLLDGKLIGGLYGIALGRVFFGESMFSHRKDASKIALAHLCALLQRLNFEIIDCQMETRHLASLGARTITRYNFMALLDQLTSPESPGLWPTEAIGAAYRNR